VARRRFSSRSNVVIGLCLIAGKHAMDSKTTVAVPKALGFFATLPHCRIKLLHTNEP
jgi:hypothetical protein